MNVRPLENVLGAAELANVLLAAVRSARQLVRALRHRRQVAALRHFDDRMLADIGISRLDVHTALATRLPADPSHVLVHSRLARRGRQEPH
jgi:uncharacterized protein YjiS (DUF1127 family)